MKKTPNIKIGKTIALIIEMILLLIFAYADGWTNQPSHQTLYTDTITSRTDASTVNIADAQGLFVTGNLNTLGNVGIGTTGPNYPFHMRSLGPLVAGGYRSLGIGNDAVGGTILIMGRGADTNSWNEIQAISQQSMTYGDLVLQRNGGNIGIGTTNPGANKLDVAGNIHATADICTDAGGGKCLSTAGGGSSAAGWTDDGTNVRLTTATDKVGIGTPTPGSELEISGQLKISSGINDKIVFAGTQAAPHTLYLDNSKGIRFWDNVNGELMRITNTGNVGIGTASPGEKLQVAGGIKVTSNLGTNVANAGGLEFLGGTRIASWGADAATKGNFIFRAISSDGSQAASPMVIDATGNVGIGTTNPGALLDVQGSNGPIVKVSYNGAGITAGGISILTTSASSNDNRGARIRFDSTSVAGGRQWDVGACGSWSSCGTGNFMVYDQTGDVARMVINSNGNVGIGTTGPTAQLQLGLTEAAGDTTYAVSSNGQGLLFKARESASAIRFADIVALGVTAGGGSAIRFFTNSADSAVERVRINQNGNVGIGSTNPGAKETVVGGDAYIATQGNGVILKATDGANCYRVTINNAGTISSSLVACPST